MPLRNCSSILVPSGTVYIFGVGTDTGVLVFAGGWSGAWAKAAWQTDTNPNDMAAINVPWLRRIHSSVGSLC